MTLVDERSQVVFVRRPFGGPARMLWDDPGGKPPAPPDPPAPPAPPPEHHADSGEVEKLRRETERLKSALAKREADDAKAKAKADASERDAAAKRGEWEKLYGESEAKGKTLAEQLEQERGKRESYEKLLSERVESSLKSVEDAELRKTWKGALEGLDPAAQLRTLDALQATAGKVKPTTARPGAVGRGNKRTIYLRELSQNTPQTRRALNEAVLADLKAKGI